LRSASLGKIVSAAQAVRLIRPGNTVATGGFVGIGFAEEVACALEARYLDESSKDDSSREKLRDLTLLFAAGQGDGNDRGLNHLAHAGLVRRAIGGVIGAWFRSFNGWPRSKLTTCRRGSSRICFVTRRPVEKNPSSRST